MAWPWTHKDLQTYKLPPQFLLQAENLVGAINLHRIGTGPKDSTTFLRGDGMWAIPPTGGGGSPGGSDTWIQVNVSGAFGGSANFTFSASTGTLTVQAATAGATSIFANTSDGVGIFRVYESSSSHGPSILAGDFNEAYNKVLFKVLDEARIVTFNCPSGVVSLGDPDSWGNNTVHAIDDATQRATFNKKFVLTDTGSLYLWNPNTSTYWAIGFDGSNNVVGTDTGSGALP